MTNTAIILAGGFGTRLRDLVKDVPKPMASVRGKPFLDYLLHKLVNSGIKEVILSTGHLANIIATHYQKERFGGLKIRFSEETTPLGTGGAIKLAMQNRREDQILILNGDSFFDIDLNYFFTLHRNSRADCSLALRYVNDSSRYGKIEISENNQIIRFSEKSEKAEPGLINGGVYLVDRKAFLDNVPAEKNFSMETEFFAKHTGHLSLKGFLFDEYFIDIGVPEDYNRAQYEFERFENR